MRQANQKKKSAELEVLCGLFSKRDAAVYISSGMRHLHSSTLGQSDPLAKATQASLQQGTVPLYPWEAEPNAKKIPLSSSATRHQLIQKVILDLGIDSKREFTEKICGVLEELISNSIYHAYSDENGKSKYPRKSAVTLGNQEQIQISYALLPTGVYLSVQDQGGMFPFQAISEAFARCYGPNKAQIQNKDSGAGLGLYMIYELTTHFKIECTPGKVTRTSCYLADKKTFDPDHFSMNYFERGMK